MSGTVNIDSALDQSPRSTGEGEPRVRIEICFFARARELAGRDSCVLELPVGSSLQILKEELERHFPSLEPWINHLLFAVDNQFLAADFVFSNDTQVLCFPPVSGG